MKILTNSEGNRKKSTSFLYFDKGIDFFFAGRVDGTPNFFETLRAGTRARDGGRQWLFKIASTFSVFPKMEV
jgi:hypothetical protein